VVFLLAYAVKRSGLYQARSFCTTNRKLYPHYTELYRHYTERIFCQYTQPSLAQPLGGS